MPLLLPWEENNGTTQEEEINENYTDNDNDDDEDLTADKQPVIVTLSAFLLILHLISSKIEEKAAAATANGVHSNEISEKSEEKEANNILQYFSVLMPLFFILSTILFLLLVVAVAWSYSCLIYPTTLFHSSPTRTVASSPSGSSSLCQHVLLGCLIFLLIMEGMAPLFCILYAFYLQWIGSTSNSPSATATTNVSFAVGFCLVVTMWICISFTTGCVKRVLYQSMGHG